MPGKISFPSGGSGGSPVPAPSPGGGFGGVPGGGSPITDPCDGKLAGRYLIPNPGEPLFPCYKDIPWEPVTDPTAPVQDPCATANNASKKMDSIYNQSNADSVVNTIPNLATQTVENGFAINKKFRVNPFNTKDTSIIGYRCDDVYTGTDSSIVIHATTNRLELLCAALHTHPASGYNAPSAKDVYDLIGECLNNYYYEGIFVAAANGNKFALAVTDLGQARTFFATKDQYLAPGAKWNEDSDIGKAFEKATDFFKDKYKKDPLVTHLKYEMAMAAVFGQFNTGITLLKQDVAGNFKPLIVKTIPDPRNPKKAIYVQDCL
jgi:hypothetical protein